MKKNVPADESKIPSPARGTKSATNQAKPAKKK